MALEVRRIVTGHDSQGRAVVATDERIAGTGAAGRAGISRVDVWSTDKMPIDNSDAAAELQRKGFRAHDGGPFTSYLSGQDFWSLLHSGYRPV